VAAFTFERLIVVRYPLKRHKICTVRRAKVIICCLTVVVAIIQILSLFTSELLEKNNDENDLIAVDKRGNNHTDSLSASAGQSVEENDLPDYHRSQVMRVITMLEAVITLAVPPVLIVIMNGLIIQGLFEFYHTFKTCENKHRPTPSHANSSDRHGEIIQVINLIVLIAFIQILHLIYQMYR